MFVLNGWIAEASLAILGYCTIVSMGHVCHCGAIVTKKELKSYFSDI